MEDLEAVAALPKLSALDVRNCGLGYRAIPVLQKMKNLNELAIMQPNSMPEFRTKLINQLPHVKVYTWSKAVPEP